MDFRMECAGMCGSGGAKPQTFGRGSLVEHARAADAFRHVLRVKPLPQYHDNLADGRRQSAHLSLAKSHRSYRTAGRLTSSDSSGVASPSLPKTPRLERTSNALARLLARTIEAAPSIDPTAPRLPTRFPPPFSSRLLPVIFVVPTGHDRCNPLTHTPASRWLQNDAGLTKLWTVWASNANTTAEAASDFPMITSFTSTAKH